MHGVTGVSLLRPLGSPNGGGRPCGSRAHPHQRRKKVPMTNTSPKAVVLHAGKRYDGKQFTVPAVANASTREE